MSDDLPGPERHSAGLPSDEQLRRIAGGVRRRIERRGRIARQVAGASAAVLVVAGGIALLAPIARTAGSATSAGGSGGSSAAEQVAVTCHDGTRTAKAEAPVGALPSSAAAACTRVLRTLPEAASGQERPTPAASPSPAAVLCETPRGILHVYLDGSGCAAHGMTQRP
ncbi:hypothetical protein [Amnibacterium setariae]|uniref:Uncharacterized protein n=1 Tax=Amnibacterium setariae TaxID=2306585 RepID=A0A3A1U593_9MICO|nr:hypothetical protein [Amnibacterium setariae]RIX30627.1 hypothetical protein D1781_04210 [Amnibacterium setariae]